MKILAYLLLLLPMSIKPIMYNFGESDGTQTWYAVNDGVMGGRSKGLISYTDQSMVFKGYVSLENNGGFASIRSPYGKMDLSAYTTLKIRFRSTGERFALTLEKHRMFYMPNYKYPLVPNGEGWTELSIPLRNFEAHRMGEPMGYQLNEENQADIIRMGLIAYNKTAGDFELEVDYIAFE